MFELLPPPAALLDFINKYKKFILLGHKEPDGDCVGSQLALASLLRGLGCTVLCCSDGPFKRTEILPYKDQFSSVITENDKKDAAAIIVDCSMPERTGKIGESITGMPLALIDHHAVGDHCGDINYVDGNSPATTILIYKIFRALNIKPSKNEVELLFFGLCTDTGFFKHLDDSSAEIFQIASELIKAGASPKTTFALMNGGKTLNSRLLLGTILSKAKSYFNGKLIFSTEEYEESVCFGMESRDSDMLYQLLQSVDGVEAVAIIRQETPDDCTVGLRSRDWVDVAKIAGSLGGGGHKNAAGILKKGIKISELQPVILAEFKKIFSV
ncbi:phosphoesterase [Spirochaetia bacterium]|nr:phosphoesterase [Spirochaetia bacterium]